MAKKTVKGCPQGQISDGKGGCKPALPPKPNTTTTTKATETAEEKAERIAKQKEAAVAAEQKRVANMSRKEFNQEKKGIKRNVKVADLKAGKEGKGGKVATVVLGALSSAVGVAEGVKNLLKKEEKKKGGAIKTKMKNGGTMKTKMKKMGTGGMHMMPDGSMMPNAAMMPPMKKGGAKKYGPGGPTGNGDGMSTMKATTPKPDYKYKQASSAGKKGTPTGPGIKTTTPTTTKTNGKSMTKSKMGGSTLKKAMYGASMMKKGGATKKK